MYIIAISIMQTDSLQSTQCITVYVHTDMRAEQQVKKNKPKQHKEAVWDLQVVFLEGTPGTKQAHIRHSTLLISIIWLHQDYCSQINSFNSQIINLLTVKVNKVPSMQKASKWVKEWRGKCLTLIPLFDVHRSYITIVMVTGFSGRRVQLEVLQSWHYVLNLSVLFTNFLPQLWNNPTINISKVRILSDTLWSLVTRFTAVFTCCHLCWKLLSRTVYTYFLICSSNPW